MRDSGDGKAQSNVPALSCSRGHSFSSGHSPVLRPAHLALFTATSADRGQNYIFPCNSGVNGQTNVGKKARCVNVLATLPSSRPAVRAQ